MATIKASTLLIAFAVAAFPVMLARAQPSKVDEPKMVVPPSAPVPAPILTSKKVFISNGGVDVDISPDHYSGGPNRAYDQFYAMMKTWGRYELVSTPADADLILELQFTAPVGPESVFKGSGGSYRHPRFTLVIKDLKTHVVLWALREDLETNDTRHLTHDKSFDFALSALVNDLAKLAGSPPAIDIEAIKKKKSTTQED